MMIIGYQWLLRYFINGYEWWLIVINYELLLIVISHLLVIDGYQRLWNYLLAFIWLAEEWPNWFDGVHLSQFNQRVGSAVIIRTPQRLVGKRHRQRRWMQSFRFPQWNMSFFMGFFHSPEHGLRKDMLIRSWKMISRWWFQTCYISQDAYFFPTEFQQNFCTVVECVETCWNMLKPSTRLWFTNKLRLKWTPFRPALRTSCEKTLGHHINDGWQP